jgi:hypothetical protein
MIAAAQPATATAQTLPPAHNVREGFDLIWGKLDDWGSGFILFIPNIVLAIIVALVFAFLAFRFVKGLIKFALLAIIVIVALWFVSGGLHGMGLS